MSRGPPHQGIVGRDAPSTRLPASPASPLRSTTMTLNDLDLFLVNLDGWFGKHNMASLGVQQTARVSYKHRETRPSAANAALPGCQRMLT